LTSIRPSLLGCLTLGLVLPVAFAAAPPASLRKSPTIPLHERIDQFLGASASLANTRSGPTSDAEFLRRVYLDLTGCIPTASEARAFLADRSANKRQSLIDTLLHSPEHARHMATTLDVMLMERLPDRFVPRNEWMEFLRKSVASNQPWDLLAKEILSGDGTNPKTRHRIKFYIERQGEPNVITRDISRLFLGTNLQCAQCHDHPRIEEYKQDDYYGLLAFVGRTTFVNDRRTRMAILSEKADGETTFQSVFDPRKVTKTALPRVPGGEAIKDPPPDKAKGYLVSPRPGVAGVPRYSRRAQLANAIARSDYLPFKRNVANRLWAHLMGRGLVDPLDMDHPANPPSHPELLDLLGDEIARSKFNMREMLRSIALSDAYQRSSELRPEIEPKEAPLYAAAILKPLTPEQLGWSLMQATGVTDALRQSLGKGATEEAIYSRLSTNLQPFIRAYASPAGTAASFDARMDQALFLANGPIVRGWLQARPGNLLGRLQKLSGEALTDELYLSILTRYPDEDERRDVKEFLARKPDGIADLAWALLASTEFRFNH
jgi:hypothetical protein